MKKTARCVGAVVTGIAVLFLGAVSAPAAEPPGFETYVVRKGDTLSKVSGRVFGDAKRWREILKANPQVTNANRIYPGDSLLVPAAEAAASSAEPGVNEGAEATGAVPSEPAPGPGATDQEAVATEAGTVTEEPPPEPLRPIALVSPALYRSAGSISDRLPQLAIVASVDDREMLGPGDNAIVNAAMSPGERFTVVRAERRVFHPRTGADLGWLIRVLGIAEVTCRGEHTSTVSLSGMRFPAAIGDYLVPVDPDDSLKESALAPKIKPECVAAGAGDGVIVAFEEERGAASEQDFAYLDRGLAQGVAPGQRFVVYRQVAPENQLAIGELQVLRVGEHTATALITTSMREVQLGDLLRAR